MLFLVIFPIPYVIFSLALLPEKKLYSKNHFWPILEVGTFLYI